MNGKSVDVYDDNQNKIGSISIFTDTNDIDRIEVINNRGVKILTPWEALIYMHPPYTPPNTIWQKICQWIRIHKGAIKQYRNYVKDNL
jgi:hypothetical protein